MLLVTIDRASFCFHVGKHHEKLNYSTFNAIEVENRSDRLGRDIVCVCVYIYIFILLLLPFFFFKS